MRRLRPLSPPLRPTWRARPTHRLQEAVSLVQLLLAEPRLHLELADNALQLLQPAGGGGGGDSVPSVQSPPGGPPLLPRPPSHLWRLGPR